MFEAIGLCKTYRSKSGVEVQALRGVTVSFGERGMVFVLGKSGSGKSTCIFSAGWTMRTQAEWK